MEWLSLIRGDRLSSSKIGIDWVLVSALVPITFFGLVTMSSFTADDPFFSRQLIWAAISLIAFFVLSLIDWRFLKRPIILVPLYILICLLLTALFVVGSVYQGAQSWLNFGAFSFQPAELAKLILIFVLAKYFSRRHIQIADFKHIAISGGYALILFLLVLMQPDFGSAIIIASIWFGMVMVSGISKKHLAFVLITGAICVGLMWTFVFEDYQKARIMNFIHPLSDVQNTGYNAYQSMITVGSGQFLGKGVGYGTQSKLRFLPEYQTDFIFAAFAEEWGFFGVFILFFLYGIVIWRVLKIALNGATNFEILYGAGLAILLMSHFVIHVGMNIGLLPVTGLTLPFMSYGGSHLLITYGAMGVLMGMRRYSRGVHREKADNELIGLNS